MIVIEVFILYVKTLLLILFNEETLVKVFHNITLELRGNSFYPTILDLIYII